MKTLLISYYWPPSGGVVIRRILALAKYLPDFAIEAILLTADGDNPWIFLDNFIDLPEIESIKVNAGDLNQLFNTQPTPIKIRLETAFRAIFNIDYMAKWQKIAVEKAIEIIEKKSIDNVIITVPPLSLLMMGKKIRESYPKIKIIGDIRDLFYSIRNDNLIQRIRRKISLPKVHRALTEFDLLVGVSPGFENELLQYNKNVITITNGFDFEIASDEEYCPDGKFKIIHTGSFPSTGQDASIILNVFKNLLQENEQFKQKARLILIGVDDAFVLSNCPELANFKDNFTAPGMLSHKEAIAIQRKADINLLLLTIPESVGGDKVIPAKLFEYIAARRPILSISNEGSVIGQMINRDGLGYSVPIESKMVENKIIYLFDLWNEKKLSNQIDSELAEKYHFKHRIYEYSKILRNLDKGQNG